MMHSRYLKSPHEFYEELATCIKENSSNKVLSTLLRMGLSGVNINDIVSGKDIPNARPLYLDTVNEEIRQHMQEFGVIMPENIHVPQPKLARPKGLDTNRIFAQHYYFRRTNKGREIFNSSPACRGFCYEYVLFNMRSHKNPNEDFLDKLLRELHEGSSDFIDA